MKCINCGADIPDSDQFCGKCGCKAEKIDSAKNENRHDTYNKKKKKPGYDIMTVMSTALALLILVVAASIIFILVINHTRGNNNDNNNNVVQGIETESSHIESNDIQPETDSEKDNSLTAEVQIQEQVVGTLTIVSDVNVRDNPDTDNSNVIKVAKASETYEYLGLADHGNWYIILLDDGAKGYVYKGYVSTD